MVYEFSPFFLYILYNSIFEATKTIVGAIQVHTLQIKPINIPKLTLSIL